MNTYLFEVKGLPQPKGSARAFMARGRPVITNDNPKGKNWERDIRAAVQDWPHGIVDAPFALTLTFTLMRPASVKRSQPTVRPDIDKLARSALDALTGVIYRDDAQVISLIAAKQYGDVPGLMGALTWG